MVNGLAMVTVEPVFVLHANSVSSGVETLVFDPGLPTFGTIDEPGGWVNIDVVDWCEDSGSRHEDLKDFDLSRFADEGEGSGFGEVGWDVVPELADKLCDLLRYGRLLVE